MYKIFKVTYNDGGWFTSGPPHFFYIAKSEEDVIANSKIYQKYLEYKNKRGGDIWIWEASGLEDEFFFENIKEFDIEINVKKKNNN